MKSILILLNGELRRPAEARRLAERSSVICADGGARHAARLGIQPRLVIGDMDSLPKRLPKWKETIFLCDFDPNVSDFEKALRFVARRGFRRLKTGDMDAIYVAGASGPSLDHVLVNLALVEKYSADLPLVLLDDANTRILSKGRHQLSCRKGDRITLLPASASAVVTTNGLAYPLRRSTLERSSRGLGNRVVSGKSRIEIHSGAVWCSWGPNSTDR